MRFPKTTKKRPQRWQALGPRSEVMTIHRTTAHISGAWSLATLHCYRCSPEAEVIAVRVTTHGILIECSRCGAWLLQLADGEDIDRAVKFAAQNAAATENVDLPSDLVELLRRRLSDTR
jgi:hypothetical protein